MALAGARVRSEEAAAEAICRELLPRVFTLEVENRRGRKTVGAGFLALGDRLAVTAWHLVEDVRRVVARFADGERVEISGFLDRNEVRDLVLLRLPVEGRAGFELFTNVAPVGLRAFVLGSPRGYEFCISDGLISQRPWVDGFRQQLVSYPISRGSSGGPVVDGAGRVLGVVVWSHKDAQNRNAATPAHYPLDLDPNGSLVPWGSRRSKRSDLGARVGSREEVGRVRLRVEERPAGRICTSTWTVDRVRR